MFQRILVPLDGSERAERVLPVAARITRASHATMVLLHVQPLPFEYGPYLAQAPNITQELVDVEQEEAKKYLARVAFSSDLAGVRTETLVLFGEAVYKILEAIQTERIDLVVIASHGNTGFRRWILGSVAQTLAFQSGVPVFIVRDGGSIPTSPYPDTTRPLRTVGAVVALDGSSLAESALPPAAHLVAALTAPARGMLHLTRIVHQSDAESEKGRRSARDLERQESALDQAKRYMRNMAAFLREGLTRDLNLAVTWSVAMDTDVTEGLIRVAESCDIDEGTEVVGGCDLIAIATHGRGGFQRWAMGSVAERLLCNTKLPLLIVRPHETPITYNWSMR